MKKVKKQKTRLQKYQTHVNKKVAALCAMTLSVSSLLSPLATSANNNSNPVYISSVSETQTSGDEYINVELSYEDIEESQLNVELNIETNFKDQLELEVPSEETPELEVPSEETPELEVPSEETPELEVPSEETLESEVPSEETPESEVPSEETPESEAPSEETPESEAPSEETSESEAPSEETPESEVLSEEKSGSEAPSEDTPESEVPSEETPKTEVEVNLESDIEALLESSEPTAELKNIDYKIAGFLNTNFSFQSIVKKLSNSFSFLTQNTKNEEQTSAFVLEIPIHSSFNLNKDTFEVISKDGETITPSHVEVSENFIKLAFDEINQIPNEFKVYFILEPSESIVSGQIVINEGAKIDYKVNNEGTGRLEIPKINLNLYQVSTFLGLPPLQLYSDSTTSNGCTNTANTTDPIKIDDNRDLCIDKLVTPQPDQNGEYTITLDTNGVIKNEEVVAHTDIVVVVDNSSSMEQEIENLRTYVDGFITNMLSLNNAQSPDAVRVAVVIFDGNAHNFFGENKIDLSGEEEETSAETHGFINKYTDTKAQDLITHLGTGYGTNTQMGIEIANDLLTLPVDQGGRPDANKYVVLFTDGEPYRNDREENYFKTNKNNFTAAQAEYYDHFTGVLNKATGPVDGYGNLLLTLGGIKYDRIDEAQLHYKPQSVPSTNPISLTTKFYTIGYFEGITIPTENNPGSEAERKKYESITTFLYTIQNVSMDLSHYQQTYFTDNINNLQTFYEHIGQDIRTEITSLLTNVKITDVVPSYFDIVEGSFMKDEQLQQPKEVSSYTGDSEKTIKWEFETLSEDGVTLSYKVKPNNAYFGAINDDSEVISKIGVNGVYTNEVATIKAKELNETEYPRPHVSIAPIEGGIKVVKSVVTEDGQTFNTDDKFSINVIGQTEGTENLGFDVTGNDNQTVSFYLRDSATDISYNKDYSKNYLMAGSYSVDEIVPANYQKDPVLIQVCKNADYNDSSDDENCSNIVLDENGRFTINKDNKYILITVTNTLVNESYWYDKEHTPNRFTYTKTPSTTED